ncbi:hypothetical protein ACWGOK_32570 [Streptomyces eurythermus]
MLGVEYGRARGRHGDRLRLHLHRGGEEIAARVPQAARGVPTADFRRFMEHEYGPTYAALPQVREYLQHYLADTVSDGAEEPIDAIVRIGFDSQSAMREASTGIHAVVADRQVQPV